MKPSYRVPTMRDIRRRKPNGLTCAGTFSGCGGSSTGFEMTGFEVTFANEFVDIAAESYRLNHPNTRVDTRSIRSITGDDVGSVDVLEGSPPCQPFSTAGKREATWGRSRRYHGAEEIAPADDLFFEFIRLAAEIGPRAIVAENVKGLVMGRAKGYFLRILEAFRNAGFVCQARVIDAQWLGVPQHRERTIIVGFRDKHDLERFVWPTPLPYRYSVTDVLPELKRAYITNRNGYRIAETSATKPLATLLASRTDAVRIRSGVGEQERHFTTKELLLLSGFPSDYKLAGTRQQQHERLGNAVPPLMMRAIAVQVAQVLLAADVAG